MFSSGFSRPRRPDKDFDNKVDKLQSTKFVTQLTIPENPDSGILRTDETRRERQLSFSDSDEDEEGTSDDAPFDHIDQDQSEVAMENDDYGGDDYEHHELEPSQQPKHEQKVQNHDDDNTENSNSNEKVHVSRSKRGLIGWLFGNPRGHYHRRWWSPNGSHRRHYHHHSWW